MIDSWKVGFGQAKSVHNKACVFHIPTVIVRLEMHFELNNAFLANLES